MVYKDMVLRQLTQAAIDERDNNYFEMAKEVEEVYRKARAFDEVLNVSKYKHEEEYADEVMEIVSKYEEE